jgi:hypothetical protein|tara:strand:+ start:302 stop:442 length:141 start_codon:yes stop_codon:yes gene_type:complete
MDCGGGWIEKSAEYAILAMSSKMKPARIMDLGLILIFDAPVFQGCI